MGSNPTPSATISLARPCRSVCACRHSFARTPRSHGNCRKSPCSQADWLGREFEFSSVKPALSSASPLPRGLRKCCRRFRCEAAMQRSAQSIHRYRTEQTPDQIGVRRACGARILTIPYERPTSDLPANRSIYIPVGTLRILRVRCGSFDWCFVKQT